MQLWQRRSHAISVCRFVLADCIYKVISQRGEKTLFERLSTPRPAPKIVLKSNWHSQQQQLPDTLDSPTSARIGKTLREGLEPTEEKEEPQFEVDLRTEGIVQDAILKDEDRMGNVKDVVD